MSRLIVVSNRVSAPKDPAEASAGGLAMALSAALRKYEGLWFGWSGETVETFTGEPKMEDRAGVTVALLDLEPQDVEEYYNGYANKTLWPLFHHRVDLTAYERSYGEGYERVNRRFAESLAPLIRPDDLIWVHDYHLIPLAFHLRRLGVTNRIGFFLHTPWPARQLLVIAFVRPEEEGVRLLQPEQPLVQDMRNRAVGGQAKSQVLAQVADMV